MGATPSLVGHKGLETKGEAGTGGGEGVEVRKKKLSSSVRPEGPYTKAGNARASPSLKRQGGAVGEPHPQLESHVAFCRERH